MATSDASVGRVSESRKAEAYMRSTETKAFSKTSEFFVWALTVAAVLIAALLIEDFGPDRAWSLATYASIGYMISRGLAKAGAREFYSSDDSSGSGR
jgi:hypothetical protein